MKGTLSALNWKKQTCLTFLITLKEESLPYDSEWNRVIEDAGTLTTTLARKFADMELLQHMPCIKDESYEEIPENIYFKQQFEFYEKKFEEEEKENEKDRYTIGCRVASNDFKNYIDIQNWFFRCSMSTEMDQGTSMLSMVERPVA